MTSIDEADAAIGPCDAAFLACAKCCCRKKGVDDLDADAVELTPHRPAMHAALDPTHPLVMAKHAVAQQDVIAASALPSILSVKQRMWASFLAFSNSYIVWIHVSDSNDKMRTVVL